MDIDFNLLNGPQRAILRESLISTFKRDDLDSLLEDAGYQSLENYTKPAKYPRQVFELVDGLSREGTLNALIEFALKTKPNAPGLRDLAQKLTLIASPPQPLDHEKLVRDSGFENLNLWADSLLAKGKCVCRISYPLEGGLASGTGFLVAPDLVLTNYHVADQAQPTNLKCNFGFAETEDGLSAGEAFTLAPNWLVAHSPATPTDLDYALLRLAKPASAFIQLPDPQPTVPTGEIVFILQHPRGNPLKMSTGVLKDSPDPLRLRYDADTAKGSSGSPVFDSALRPLALHHASDIQHDFNQGIPLATILHHIRQTAPGVLP